MNADDVVVKRIDELEHYQGEHAIPGITFRYAGRNLGVTAWGMNVFEMEPGCERYPEHDHQGDGQEEVYVVLRGAVTLRTAAGDRLVEEGALVRVPPSVRRKLIPGAEGATVLAIGGTPGKAYGTR